MPDSYLIINGKRRLCGETDIQGAKNSALPCLTACLACEKGQCSLLHCPCLSDVENTADILEQLGARCEFDKTNGVMLVSAENAFGTEIDGEMMNRMRSSILFLGVLLSRWGEATIGYPGGCAIGARPIDLHLKAFRRLGVHIDEGCGTIRCRVPHGLTPCSLSLICPSVGATENIMLLMARSNGTTILSGAAREPEIVDLQRFLNRMGANIRGAGSDTIVIDGVKSLHGAELEIMPDRIVAATYMAAAAACGGEIRLLRLEPDHLAVCISILRDMGADISIDNSGIIIKQASRPSAVKTIKTLYYPGFPTDAQPAFMAAASVADGTTVFIESIFENRFRHAAELNKLGADIDINICQATVRGCPYLSGTEINSYDLRGGAAMVIGGLAAEGTTRVNGVSYIERGYADITADFARLGADIRYVC